MGFQADLDLSNKQYFNCLMMFCKSKNLLLLSVSHDCILLRTDTILSQLLGIWFSCSQQTLVCASSVHLVKLDLQSFSLVHAVLVWQQQMVMAQLWAYEFSPVLEKLSYKLHCSTSASGTSATRLPLGPLFIKPHQQSRAASVVSLPTQSRRTSRVCTIYSRGNGYTSSKVYLQWQSVLSLSSVCHHFQRSSLRKEVGCSRRRK
jgi:hypothetical protein